jgi:hypothetical protein
VHVKKKIKTQYDDCMVHFLVNEKIVDCSPVKVYRHTSLHFEKKKRLKYDLTELPDKQRNNIYHNLHI